MRIDLRGLVVLATSTLMAGTLVLASPASAADVPITPVTPTVAGTVQYEKTLTAVPGAWTPSDVTFSYQWLRDGAPIGSNSPANRTRKLASSGDVGKRYSVRVTASRPGSTPVTAVSAATRPVARATIKSTKRPTVKGSGKYGKTLTASSGRWSRKADRLEYRWLRDGRAIGGANKRKYTIRASDVGSRISFRVQAKRAGFTTATAVSKAKRGKHVRGVRKTVTYSVTTRGSVKASVATFKKLAQETYDDPRGWRAMGVKLKRVSSGGDFTLVLSQASKVPSFSSACSTTYSCRVGRHVIINETRWQKATPAWNAKKGSLRNYRHMVVNHETGHWFERGHASCGGKGQLAPVMQQQSKGLNGCKINPWPKKNELHSSRFGF